MPCRTVSSLPKFAILQVPWDRFGTGIDIMHPRKVNGVKKPLPPLQETTLTQADLDYLLPRALEC